MVALQRFFKLSQCVGVLGGRPNHALYFIGMKDDKVRCVTDWRKIGDDSQLIYLDPHYTQNTLTSSASEAKLEGFDVRSFISWKDWTLESVCDGQTG